MRGRRGRHRLRLLRGRPGALWRGGFREGQRAGARDRRKARSPALALRGDRALLPRRNGAGAGAGGAPSARGELEITTSAGDVSRRRRARGAEDGPRLCLARHRHPCLASRCGKLRAHAGGAAGAAHREPGRDRLPPGLDRPPRAGTSGRGSSARTITGGRWPIWPGSNADSRPGPEPQACNVRKSSGSNEKRSRWGPAPFGGY